MRTLRRPWRLRGFTESPGIGSTTTTSKHVGRAPCLRRGVLATLGVAPASGRLIRGRTTRGRAPRPVVLDSDGLRRERFGAPASTAWAGRLSLDGTPHATSSA
jgi:hypothetical protein